MPADGGRKYENIKIIIGGNKGSRILFPLCFPESALHSLLSKGRPHSQAGIFHPAEISQTRAITRCAQTAGCDFPPIVFIFLHSLFVGLFFFIPLRPKQSLGEMPCTEQSPKQRTGHGFGAQNHTELGLQSTNLGFTAPIFGMVEHGCLGFKPAIRGA